LRARYYRYRFTTQKSAARQAVVERQLAGEYVPVITLSAFER
jgi:hypothetical protein